jgi:orotate phosphoribosyltransferase
MEKTLVTVAQYDTVFEADLARSFLAENQIESYIINEYMGQIIPSISNDLLPVELQVNQEDEEKAIHILEAVIDSYYTQKLLEESGALLNGHFQLTSGLHSDRYVEKIKIVQDPVKVVSLCQKLAIRLQHIEADVVIGPAYGGIVLAFEVARQSGRKFAFTQRENDKMVLRSGFVINPGSRAIIIEDIVTTGNSVNEVVEALRERNIEVVAIGVIVDRSHGNTEFGIHTESLLTLDLETYDPSTCPLCAQGMILVKPGSSDKK